MSGGELARELRRHIGAHADIVANDILASGWLERHAADVRARALEDAADALENEQSPGDDTTLHFPSLLREMHVATTTAQWLRDRAVSEREGGDA